MFVLNCFQYDDDFWYILNYLAFSLTGQEYENKACIYMHLKDQYENQDKVKTSQNTGSELFSFALQSCQYGVLEENRMKDIGFKYLHAATICKTHNN